MKQAVFILIYHHIIIYVVYSFTTTMTWLFKKNKWNSTTTNVVHDYIMVFTFFLYLLLFYFWKLMVWNFLLRSIFWVFRFFIVTYMGIYSFNSSCFYLWELVYTSFSVAFFCFFYRFFCFRLSWIVSKRDLHYDVFPSMLSTAPRIS